MISKDKLNEEEIQEIREKIKELACDMMIHEIHKIDYKNDLKFNTEFYGEEKARKIYEYSVYQADTCEYKSGLKFKKLKLENEHILSLNTFVLYPDTARISARRLLDDYNLSYVEGWCFTGNKIVYLEEDQVKENYGKFLTQVDELFDNNKISEFEKERLYLAGNYFYNCDKLTLESINKQNKDMQKIKK